MPDKGYSIRNTVPPQLNEICRLISLEIQASCGVVQSRLRGGGYCEFMIRMGPAKLMSVLVEKIPGHPSTDSGLPLIPDMPDLITYYPTLIHIEIHVPSITEEQWDQIHTDLLTAYYERQENNGNPI